MKKALMNTDICPTCNWPYTFHGGWPKVWACVRVVGDGMLCEFCGETAFTTWYKIPHCLHCYNVSAAFKKNQCADADSPTV